jgi:16S rRNA (cytosine1402-N4)-methyltransferase
MVEKYNLKPVQGVLLDLGLSSWHLEKSGRGFSFQKNEPLDMRYDTRCQISNVKCRNLTAMEIINSWSKEQIEKILKEYGEEKFAPRIANQIVKKRKTKPIKTTFELVEIIKSATPAWYHHQRIHCATRTFQALRIVVNNELKNLETVLPQAVEILVKGGRLVVISFHSLEDRIVKNYFRNNKRLKILFKKPIRPDWEEKLKNQRSRSAHLRAAEKDN